MAAEELTLRQDPPAAEVLEAPADRLELRLVGERVDRLEEALPHVAGDRHEFPSNTGHASHTNCPPHEAAVFTDAAEVVDDAYVYAKA